MQESFKQLVFVSQGKSHPFYFMNSYNHRPWSGGAGIAEFLLLFDLLPLHLRTFAQGGALDTDSGNVSVGAITLSSVAVCWEGKDFQ